MRRSSIFLIAFVALGCGSGGANGPSAGSGGNGPGASGNAGGAGSTGAAGASSGGAGASATGEAGAGAAGATGAAGAAGKAGGAAGKAGGAGAAGAAGKAGGAGATGAAGKSGGAGATGSGGAGGNMSTACDAPGLVWKTGSKTNFTSYPAPGSDECIKYSGCMYEGMFAGCNKTEPLAWVMTHNIVAAFPDFNALKLHDLCLKSSTGKTIVVTVLDTCGDSDCSGCCTQNKGTADELIDVESFTNMRWGVQDGRIQWADLGPTTGSGCQ